MNDSFNIDLGKDLGFNEGWDNKGEEMFFSPSWWYTTTAMIHPLQTQLRIPQMIPSAKAMIKWILTQENVFPLRLCIDLNLPWTSSDTLHRTSEFNWRGNSFLNAFCYEWKNTASRVRVRCANCVHTLLNPNLTQRNYIFKHSCVHYGMVKKLKGVGIFPTNITR